MLEGGKFTSGLETMQAVHRQVSLPRIVEFEGSALGSTVKNLFGCLSHNADIVLIRGLPEALQVRHLLLRHIRYRYSDDAAERVNSAVFERQSPLDEFTVSVFLAAARHLRDSGAMTALFSGLFQAMQLPPPVNVDCGFFRLVLPQDMFDRMAGNHDLTNTEDWYYAAPFDGVERMLMRGTAMPHRDISRPHYAFQFNVWFPLIDLTEAESLHFFPEAYWDYKDRIERLSGGASQGFEQDVAAVGAKIASVPAPDRWGFGTHQSRDLRYGDVYLFNCQQPHASPPRNARTYRLSVELRVAARSYDDNTGYRRCFSNINNYLPRSSELPKVTVGSGIGRATALLAADLPLAGGPADLVTSDASVALENESSQCHINSLFPTPAIARVCKEISCPPSGYDVAPAVSSAHLLSLVNVLDRFPFAEDRQLLLARVFLRRGDFDAAAKIASDASRASSSYFWQLFFAHVAIRAGKREQTRQILDRCVELAAQTVVEKFPFFEAPDVPSGPIITMLPKQATRAAASMRGFCDRAHDGILMRDEWYSCDPRLFHPHAYLLKTEGPADIYRSGSLYLALPAGQAFVPELIANRYVDQNSRVVCCFGESVEELRCELEEQQSSFSDAAANLERKFSYDSVKLLMEFKGYNIVRIRDRYFGVPLGLKVDWGSDDVDSMPRIIKASGAAEVKDAIERLMTGRMAKGAGALMSPGAGARTGAGFFGSLESLRGLASLSVVLIHCLGAFVTIGKAGGLLAPAMGHFFNAVNGRNAVVLFFVLSGFVLSASVAKAPVTRSTLAGFLVRRAFRILPLAYLVMAVATLHLLMARPAGDLSPYMNQWMLNGYFKPHLNEIWDNVIFRDFRLNSVFWTLNVELLASIAFVPLFWLNTNIGALVRVWILVGLLTLPLFSNALVAQYLFCFQLGIIAYLSMRYTRSQAVSLDTVPVLTLLAVGAGGFITLYAHSKIVTWISGVIGRTLEPGASDYVQILLEAVGAAIVVYGCAVSRSVWLDRALGSRVLRHLGKISFSLYCIHLVVLKAMMPIWVQVFGESLIARPALGPLLNIAIAVPLSFVLADLAYRRVEKPAMSFGARAGAAIGRRLSALTGESLTRLIFDRAHIGRLMKVGFRALRQGSRT